VHWLRPATAQSVAQREPLGMASFPLLPFCNRIRNGKALFAGREIALAPNHPAQDSPHPLHGMGWLLPWRVVQMDGRRAVLQLDVRAGAGWPWSFSAQQIFELSPSRLDVQLELSNQDTAAMPAGLGHHPYFPHLAQTRLQTDVQAIWEADAEVMPTAANADSEIVRRLREGVELAQLELDNNFAGWGRRADMHWPADAQGPARSLSLQAESPLDHFVLYSPRAADHFCAEPVSQCTDWVNLRERHAPSLLGGAVLEPGARLSGRFSLVPAWS
jgi:aldose 1-epimerase